MSSLPAPVLVAGIGGLLLVLIVAALQLRGSGKPTKPALDPKEWLHLPLVSKDDVAPNTALYRFALPHPEQTLGLPIGQHVSIQATVDGKNVMRSYTPTSSDDDKGVLDLLVKSYPTGNISKHFSTLNIGDKLQIKGPKGQMRYHRDYADHIGMIAGGTGITPCYQIIKAALKDDSDTTRISLLYANVNHEDILLKKELDELAATYPQKFKVHYFLNNAPEGWTQGVGFVSKEAIETHIPAPGVGAKVLMCGTLSSVLRKSQLTDSRRLCASRPSPYDHRHEEAPRGYWLRES